MFQLNNNKKTVIFIIIFAVVAILTTSILILIKNPKFDNINNKEAKLKEKDKYGISSLTEKYIVNELEFERCDDEDNYIKSIRGLKDKEVEKKINKKISGCKYYASEIIGNAITFFNYDDRYENVETLNIRLDTGEEYTFEEIFLAETNIDQIISQGVNFYFSCKYSNYGCHYLYDFYLDDEIKKPTDFDLDEEIYKYLNIYHEEGIKVFSIDSSILTFRIGDLEFFLPFESIWKELAIYKRFVTKESIFEKESTLLNYVLSYYRGNKYNGFILDNLFLEEYYYDNEEIPQKTMNLLAKQTETVKNKVIEIAKKDVNNMYFLLVGTVAYKETDENIYGNYSQVEVYKINKKDYERLGGEEYLAKEQRRLRMGDTFQFYDDYMIKVDIDDLIRDNFKVMDKNGNVLKNYCYIEYCWEKVGAIVSIWNNDYLEERNYLVEENCKLTLQN